MSDKVSTVETLKRDPFEWLGGEPQGDRSFHTIEIKTRVRDTEKSYPSPTGHNAIILLDGKPLKGVMNIKVEMKAKDLNKVTIEMIANVGGPTVE